MALGDIRSGSGGIARGNFNPSQLGSMLGITMTMDPTPAIMVRNFNKVGHDLNSFRVPLQKAIEEVVAPSVRTNFDVGGRPKWEPLSPDTLKLRELFSRGGGTDILVETGKLRDIASSLDIWTVTNDDAYVQGLPEEVWYGVLHQGGYVDRAKRVPARPFLVLQSEDLDRIEEVFGNWLEERVQDADLG